jgi:Cullin family
MRNLRVLVVQPDRKLEADLDVKVLTTGFWPTYPAVPLTLPAEMAEAMSTFQQFYADSTKYRKLVWLQTLVRRLVLCTLCVVGCCAA